MSVQSQAQTSVQAIVRTFPLIEAGASVRYIGDRRARGKVIVTI